MFSREVNYYTDVELRDDYENNTLRIDAERYLQRPSYHFRPEKDWMNGVSSTTCLLSKVISAPITSSYGLLVCVRLPNKCTYYACAFIPIDWN